MHYWTHICKSRERSAGVKFTVLRQPMLAVVAVRDVRGQRGPCKALQQHWLEVFPDMLVIAIKVRVSTIAVRVLDCCAAVLERCEEQKRGHGGWGERKISFQAHWCSAARNEAENKRLPGTRHHTYFAHITESGRAHFLHEKSRTDSSECL